ncbi:hypothetical protein EDB83DRAFT_2629378 [Lactarius deliciosus]|nr:hypothetical protein EDB83DRAFT_2629378 [Lactarius deliciosus]
MLHINVQSLLLSGDGPIALVPHRVEDARLPALGDEVSRAVDVAVGSSFRGARLSPLRQLTPSRSFMNTVILSSVISAGNHALFAGTRVLYSLATASYASPLFAWTTRGGVPLPALVSAISAVCPMLRQFFHRKRLAVGIAADSCRRVQPDRLAVHWDCVVALLAPTHELAVQIQQECTKLGSNSRIRNTAIYGGAPKGPQIRDFLRVSGS